jgi:hypothetical protein
MGERFAAKEFYEVARVFVEVESGRARMRWSVGHSLLPR